MRIAFFTEAYDPYVNGVVVMVRALKAELERRGHEVMLFAPRSPGWRDVEDGVCRLPSVAWSRRGYPCLRPLSGADEAIDAGRFDILHSHHPFSTGLLAERLSCRFDRPLVHTFHTLLPNYSGYLPLPHRWSEAMLTGVVRRHCDRSDRITVSTREMAGWLRLHGVTRPLSLVPPVIHPLPAADGGREEVRRQCGVAADETLLLYAGRLSLEKRVDMLLHSVARLARKRSWRLLLAGDGPCRDDLIRLAGKLGISDRIVFAGEVPHSRMGDTYAAADLFVFPSPSDTFGLVLAEAMSAGLPCVAVGLNGPREVVADGTTGLLTPFEETAFASAIDRLIGNGALRVTMGSAARQRARRLWVDAGGDALVDTYGQAIESRAIGKRFSTVGGSRETEVAYQEKRCAGTSRVWTTLRRQRDEPLLRKSGSPFPRDGSEPGRLTGS